MALKGLNLIPALKGLNSPMARKGRPILIWAALAAAIGLPLAAAANSEFLAWRTPTYIVAGFAGIVALAIVLLQPLLIGGALPGISGPRTRTAHNWTGAALVAAVAVHIAGLWLTSPPDMIDALTFSSPTLFSPFGVLAAWAILAVALLALFRRRLPLRPQTWRLTHMTLAVIIGAGAIAHAMLIEGTMETLSKTALCALTLAATVKVMAARRVWRIRPTPTDRRQQVQDEGRRPSTPSKASL